ncbi:MAG: NFACT RNA binding domain-containing protein [Treponemataceae bacterium]
MSLNCNEINLILEELDLSGSFIQQIVQPSFDSIAFYTYKEGRSKTVFISLAAGACRINETKKKIPKNEKPLRFMEFLKSRIKGFRINLCSQIGMERIIRFDLSNREKTFFMFVRLWSNAANIILTNEDFVIQDAFYRRPKKNEITGSIFDLPKINEQTKEFKIRDFSQLKKEYDSKRVSISNSSGEFSKLKEFENLSYNEKVELYYSEHASSFSRQALLEQAKKLYSEHRIRIESAISKLEKKRTEFLECNTLKHMGDLILTYAHLIDNEHNFFDCEDYDTGLTIRIGVDPKKSAQDNAKLYYERYKKACSGLEELEYDINKAKIKLRDLNNAYESILQEPNSLKIQQLIRKQTKPKQQTQKKRPGITYEIDGWTIFVGRDADENDELLRHHVKGQDLWMHTRDFAGGYVFIKNRVGKTIPLEILLNAGNLALHFSKARKAGQADLYYTEVKFLRRAKNGAKGLVLPTHEKNLTIKLDNERLRLMEQHQIES